MTQSSSVVRTGSFCPSLMRQLEEQQRTSLEDYNFENTRKS